MDNGSSPDIFSVSVIWDIFGQYLNQSDFFNLRRVNSKFKTQVDNCLHFQKQSWRSIWMVISDITVCFRQEETSINCKNIRVAFVKQNSSRIRNLNSIPTSEFINKFTKGLKFSIFFEGANTSTIFVMGTPEAATTALKEIIKPIEVLNNLKFNSFVFGAIKADGVWQDLPKLKYFAVFYPANSKVKMLLTEKQQLIQNFDFISQTLKSLNIFTSGGLEDSTPLCQSVATILTKSVSTLTFLDIRQSKCWSLLGNSVKISFLSLKTLKFKGVYSENREILTSFLENQPLLEHLDMGWDRLPKAVYDIISGKSSKLRILQIKAKSFGPGEIPGDWNFLSQLNLLYNFQMKRPSSSLPNNIANFDQIIQALPKLQVRRIHLRGLICHPVINAHNLEEFPNLKEISIMRCLGAVNDNTLKNISKSRKLQQNLEVLELSLCDNVTNSGVQGLVSLTALRKLTIKGCRRVTDSGVGRLYFPKLKHCDLSYNTNVSKSGLLAAARANPGLEYFLGSWKIDNELNNPGNTQFRTSYKIHDRGGILDTDSEAE